MLKVIERDARITLRIESVESLDDLKREMDTFVKLATTNGHFTIEVTMVTGRARKGNKTTLPGNKISLALEAFEDAIGKVPLRTYLNEHGISRSSWYNWKGGTPVKPHSLERLIAVAPTEEVRNMLIGLRQ